MDLDRIREHFHTKVDFYTSKGVVRELKRISGSGKSVAPFAAVALKIIEQKNIEVAEDKRYPDDWLLEQEIIATVDVPLIRKARSKGIRVVTLSESGRVSIK